MPKWVKIGLLLLLSPFVLYFLAGLFHRPNSLEYHVKGYLKEGTWDDRDEWIASKTPLWVNRLWVKRKSARREKHQMALIRFGFLEEHTVAVSNASANAVMAKALNGIDDRPHSVGLIFLDWDATDDRAVRFVSKSRDAEFLTGLIREADAPETTNWINSFKGFIE